MSQDQEDEIVLAELPDAELVEQMFDDLYDGLAEEIAKEPRFCWTGVGTRRRFSMRRWSVA